MGFVKRKKITITKTKFIKLVGMKVKLDTSQKKNIIGYYYGRIYDYARFYGGDKYIRDHVPKAVKYLRSTQK